MPEVIGAIILEIVGFSAAEAAAIGFTIAGVTITYASIIGAVVLAAASFAISSALMPSVNSAAQASAAKVQDQLSLQQPVPFRRRIYGRAKMGGYFVFWTSAQGALYSLLAVAAHEIDAYEEFWIADRRVSLDGSGNVTGVTAPAGADPTQFNPGGATPVQIYSDLGGPGKAAYAALTAAFPGVWTAAHIGVGIADVLLVEGAVPQEKFSQVYPGGQQTVRVLGRFAKIYDPRDGTQVETDPTTWKWSDNAACVVLDYLTHADGWRISKDVFLTGSARAITLAAMDVADELIPLVAGGTEKRYRLWGGYDFSEEPRTVLARMLAACAGWLQPLPDGTIAIHMGKWEVPTFTITEDMILGFEIQHFTGEFDTINEVRATFPYSGNDYQDTETTPFQDEADIAARGYIKSTTVDARHCPSFTQARRIQKIGLKEGTPQFSMNLTLSIDGIGARAARFLNFDLTSLLGISGTARLTSFVANLKSQTCTIGMASFGPDAFDWDPATEEGPPPPVPTDSSSVGTVEAPTGLIATVQNGQIAGANGAVISLSCNPAVFRTDLNVKFEYQLAASGNWTTLSQGTQTYQTQTGVLPNGTYNVRASFVAPDGVQSDFDTVNGVVVAATEAAPSVPTGLSALAASPNVVIDFTAPNSLTFAAARVWRNTVNNFATATDISGALYGSANQDFTFNDARPAGTWWYWATAESSTGTRSGQAGPVSITV